MKIIKNFKRWLNDKGDENLFGMEFDEFSGSYPLRNPNAKREYIEKKMRERGK